MKTQNIGNLLWYMLLFQTVITILKLRSSVDAKISHQCESCRKAELYNMSVESYEEAEKFLSYTLDVTVLIFVDTRETRSVITIPLPIDENNLEIIKKKLDLKKELVFIIHGFRSNGKEQWLKQLSSAYLKRKDVIVLRVDWGTAAMDVNYFAVVRTLPLVAKELVSFVDVLTKQLEAKASNIHIIGHSLGAHISGLIGQGIPDINRITGLDPAGPFIPYQISHLSSRSAEYIDMVHTSGLFGSYEHLEGQVDFYINGGIMQPGCGIESIWQFPESQICSHGRAHTYFIESIENPDCNFVASETKERAEKVRSNDFDPKQDTVLGLDTFKYKTKGKFYITTNSDSPHCRKLKEDNFASILHSIF